MQRRHYLAVLSAFVAVVATAQTATVEPPAVRLDVPFVPTPEEVVAQMIKLAKVTKNDVIYDLGSGDGRIVIAAVKQSGARGVGVDIDPRRIEEANENATKAGVADRVKFVQQDLFKADIRPATVVTLYLLPDINLKLLPKLLAELRPGTRIVSHNFHMGDWKPQQTVQVGNHTVFYWEVPKGGKVPK